MKTEQKRSILESLLVQFCGMIILFAGWISGLYFKKIGFIISVIIYVLVLILFFFLKKENRKVHLVSLITSLATGILIGSFISEYSKDVVLVIKSIGILTLIIFVIHGILLITKYHKTVLGLIIGLLVIAIIVGFTMFKHIIAKELTLLGINLLFTLIGLIIYFNKGRDLDVYIAGSFLWAFIVIFIIIIIILSEGDAITGFDVGVSGRDKKKKKGM